MSSRRDSTHFITERPDELHNPLMLTPLTPPEEILFPVTVNMNAEEKQGRKIAWIMDDLNRDIAKLRVIFVERLTEPTEKMPEGWKTKTTPDLSHDILKNLSSILDWLAEIKIDGESFALPITDEEMKLAQEKPAERKNFISEQAGNLQKILEDVVEKALKLVKFIAGRQNVLDKFYEYMGDKADEKSEPVKTKSARFNELQQSLKKLELENFEDIEKLIIEHETELENERKTVRKLNNDLFNMKYDMRQKTALLSKVPTIKALTNKFLVKTENTLAQIVSDENVKMELEALFSDFKMKMKKEFNAFDGTKSLMLKEEKSKARNLKESISRQSRRFF